ncbi:hypothetical protein TUM12370_30440 [Salmonella enterica subsp. enterica serovar Choleraesuis]|nr:hypothetical protein TUM12370_30440 [Salmonella enterica subsp. enterica serovar Choleraesuis]
MQRVGLYLDPLPVGGHIYLMGDSTFTRIQFSAQITYLKQMKAEYFAEPRLNLLI